MIKRFCDICGQELKEEGHIFNLPRIQSIAARGGKGGKTVLAKVKRMGYEETEMCPKCEYKLAMALPVVDYD